MNYGASLAFVFQDQDWIKKILIGGLFRLASFTGILLFLDLFPYGYTFDILRRQTGNLQPLLPDWDDLGKKFIDGLLGVLIYFCYTLLFGSLGALWIVYFATSESISEPTRLTLIILGGLFILFGIVYFGSAGLILFILKGRFSSAFHLPRVIRFFRADFLAFTGIILFSIFLCVMMFLIGFGIFSPFTVFWAQLVSFHLMAQYAAKFPEFWQ